MVDVLLSSFLCYPRISLTLVSLLSSFLCHTRSLSILVHLVSPTSLCYPYCVAIPVFLFPFISHPLLSMSLPRPQRLSFNLTVFKKSFQEQFSLTLFISPHQSVIYLALGEITPRPSHYFNVFLPGLPRNTSTTKRCSLIID